MTRNNFHWMMVDAGFNNIEEMARFFEVSPGTIRRWKKNKPPKAVFLCLKFMSGDLSFFGKKWENWKINVKNQKLSNGKMEAFPTVVYSNYHYKMIIKQQEEIIKAQKKNLQLCLFDVLEIEES